MEKRDLYDINKILTGETIYKNDPIPEGRYILVVLVFIQNSKGEFLIQKRSIQKDGKYGSHVFFDIYYLKKDIEIKDLILQKEEVEFVEWASISKIKKLIQNGLFLESHAEEVFRMIEIFKKRGVYLE